MKKWNNNGVEPGPLFVSNPDIAWKWLHSHHPKEKYVLYTHYNARKDLFEVTLYGTFGETYYEPDGLHWRPGTFNWRADYELYAEHLERAENKDEFIWNFLEGLLDDGIQMAIDMTTGRWPEWAEPSTVIIPEHLCTNWGP